MGEQYSEDRDNLQDLLHLYEQLKQGSGRGYLEEDSFERIILHFQDQEAFDQALEAAQWAVDRFPYSAMLKIKMADVLILLRRFREANSILDEAKLLDHRDINLYILKTEIFLALERPEEAVLVRDESLELFEGEERIELLFEMADVFDDYEEYERVFECIREVLIAEPTNEEALYKVCFWTDFTGRNEEGIRLHMEILEDHPYSELAWFNLGAAYQGLKLYEKAIDAYQYAIAIEEKFDYAYRNMGDAYLRLRKYKEAVEVLEKVVALTRPEDVIYEAIGHCYHKLGKIAQARFYYKKAVHLNPDDSKLYYKIAVTYMLEKQWQPAVKQLENAMRMHRAITEYNLAMGECKANLGQFKEAVHYFGVVVKHKPKNVSGWEALIQCLLTAEYFDEALLQSKNAFVATDHKPVFLFYHSAILFIIGKSKDGLILLEQAMVAAPKLLKKFIDIRPSILQNAQVVDVIARFKRRRKI